MNIYSIKDVKTGSYSNPFFENHDEIAKRAFGLNVNRGEGSLITEYPEDYALVRLGTFDETTGKFDILKDEYFISNAYSLKKGDDDGEKKTDS